MNKKFTFLMAAAIMLLALVTQPMRAVGQAVSVGDTLWFEPFQGTNTSTTFSATSSWGDYVNPMTFVQTDASSLAYSSSNAMLSSGSGANMSGAHVWLNKSTTGFIQVTGINLYNTTKIKVSWAQGGSSTVKVAYAFDGGTTYTDLSNNASATATFTSDELDVTGHTTINLKFYRTSTNTNIRIDNLTLKATEVASLAPTITIKDDITELVAPNYVVGTPKDYISYETFTVNGSNLEANVTLTLNENSNFQMSTNLETWTNTLSLTQTDGSVSETVAVRLKAGLSVNDYSGQITLTSTNADPKAIDLSGSVTYAHVTYNGNGATSGSVPVDNNNYSYNGTVTVLGAGDLAKTGHTFAYWTTDAAGYEGPYEANGTYTITDNTTFYAQWFVNTHTVTLPDADEFGIYEMTPTNPVVAYGTQVTLQYEPEDGYEDYVAAWSINGEAITGNTFTMPDEDVTVTVACSPAPGTATNPYTVAQAIANTPSTGTSANVYVHGIVKRFQSDEGILGDNNHRYYIYDGGNTTELLVFNGKGLNNVEFSNNNDLLVGDEVTIYGGLTTYTTNNTTIKEIAAGNYIVSLVREYRVTYDANGATSGSVPTDATVYTEQNNTVTVLGNTGNLAKDCNEWGGWNTEEDGSGDTYQANQTFTITSNTTLYAIWTARTHSYTLNQTGATQYIEEVAIYVPDQGGWEEGGPIQCGQQVSVSVILDNENYYYTISVMAGSESVTVNNDMFTMPDSDVTITVEVLERPTYSITCNAAIGNGTISAPAEAALGATVTVTVTPQTGYVLNTLTATYVDNGNTVALALSNNTFEMPAADVTLNAMFAKGIEDVLNRAFTGIGSGDGYSNWSGKTSNSTAVYAGNSAGGNNAIQLRSSNSSGIITTASGGKAKKVVVTWNINNDAAGRDLDIYGKNSPYSSASDLYDNNKRGTKLGSINSKTDTEITINGDYEYIGIRSNKNALYLDEIKISWVYSCTEDVVGHGDDNTTGWQFIASPIAKNVTVNVPAGDGADLYYYDEPSHFWKNYKKDGNAGYFGFANGTGYLYANKSNVTLTFAGDSLIAANTKDINLSYTAAAAPLDGWNLVGNPFNSNATLNMDCFIIEGLAINTTAQTAGTYIVAPCQGVMVKATGANQAVTFTKVTNSQAPQSNQLQVTVAQQVMNRGAVTNTVNDNVIVNFDEGSLLEKFSFNADAAKLYIPQNDKEYAIVSAEAQGEMPLNFRANADGQYTLTVNPEGVEMNYLHLIDNMTGNDIDLLQTPSYSFNAKTTDYESRFRLVFAANNESSVSASSTTFAFYSNGNWMVNNEGEATLQIIDVMGRVLSNQTISGTAELNLNQVPGVYVLRLVNGNDVKTQKIVVR